MDTLVLAFLSTQALLIVLCKAFGLRRVVRWQVPVDILCTLGLPMLFLGSYHGMVLAIMTGLLLSVELYILSLCMSSSITTPAPR